MSMGQGSGHHCPPNSEWGTRKQLNFNVILTTYEIALREAALFNSVRAALTVDEAHRLKNDEAQQYRVLNDLKTEHRLLIWSKIIIGKLTSHTPARPI